MEDFAQRLQQLENASGSAVRSDRTSARTVDVTTNDDRCARFAGETHE